MKLFFMMTILVGTGLAQNVPTDAHFKSTCFSGACIGDDLNKLGGLKLAWLTLITPPTPPPPGLKQYGGRQQTRPTRPANVNSLNLQEVQKAFRGLTDADYKVVAEAFPLGSGPDRNIDFFRSSLPRHIEINAVTLPILEKATTCSALPVHGVFKSESGHYTDVLLMSDNGKLRVVKTTRRWMPNFPSTATAQQKSQIANQQLMELMKQINDVYGGSWIIDKYFVPPVSRSARNADAVAYFNYSDTAHPVLTFYSAAFSKFQQQSVDSSPIQWNNVTASYERALANTPGCAVTIPTVKID